MSYNKFQEFTNDQYLFQLATLMEFAPLHITTNLYDFANLYLETLFVIHDESKCEYDVLKYGDHAFYWAILIHKEGFVVNLPISHNMHIDQTVIADMIKDNAS